jgi:hypothetical protein
MMRLGWLVAGCVVALSYGIAWATSGESEVADHALAIVLAELGASIDSTGIALPGIQTRIPEELWAHATFGDISERLVGNDIRPSRFHEPGKTIWEELGDLDQEALETRVKEASTASATSALEHGSEEALAFLERGEGNVVTSYVVLHVLALRCSSLRSALVYEAAAQAYLRAAFFAAHMLVPFGSPLWPLHAENTRRMHNHFRDTGLYVRNGAGDPWQTFGDEVLESHSPTYRFILEASATSLRELFTVFLLNRIDRPGLSRLFSPSFSDSDLVAAAQHWTPRYRNLILGHHALLPSTRWVNRFMDYPKLMVLEERTLGWINPPPETLGWIPETGLHPDGGLTPTLRLFPVPVTATMVEQDSSGTFSSYEHPQLKEAGYHDPELNPAGVHRLPSKSQFPKTADLRRWNPESASVLYPAPHTFPPSFLGMRTDVELTQLAGVDGSTFGVAAGLGYAWPAGLYDLCLRVGYLSRIGDGFLVGTLGPRIENPFPSAGLQWIDAFLLEVGYVHDLEGSWSESGAVLGLSAITRAWPGLTSFVNMGPAFQFGGRVYVRKLPLVGLFVGVGFQ